MNPSEIIQHLRTFLHTRSLLPIEGKWICTEDLLHSVLLSLPGESLQGCGTGPDSKQSLALAYLDFTEKLILESLEEYARLDRESGRENSVISPLIALGDMKNKREYAFRADFLKSIQGVVTVGSSREEALVNGLYRLFAYFVYHQVQSGRECSFPAIPPKFWRRPPCHELAVLLEQAGYELSILDCSATRRLPVVGILIRKKDSAYFVTGAGHSLPQALSRCFSELFRAGSAILEEKLQPVIARRFSRNSVREFPLATLYPYSGFLSLFDQAADHNSPINPFLFKPVLNFDQSLPLFPGKISLSQQLEFLTGLVDNLGHSILIKGIPFPGLHVFVFYIPGISLLYDRKQKKISLTSKERYENT